MGIDLNEPSISSFGEFKVFKPITNEVTISNPLHAWLLMGVLIFVVVRPKSVSEGMKLLILLGAATFVLMSLAFKWQIFGGRFQLTFFNLMMPVVGIVLAQKLKRHWIWVISICFAIASLPWLLSIQSRPILSTEQSTSASILAIERESLYFANGRYLENPYQDMTTLILQADCKAVGIFIPGAGAEYPIWALLGAPNRDLRIEWIVAGTPSQVYRDQTFEPCALICDGCPTEWEDFNGIPISYNRSGYRLYMDHP
jgi:hypothetical protein